MSPSAERKEGSISIVMSFKNEGEIRHSYMKGRRESVSSPVLKERLKTFLNQKGNDKRGNLEMLGRAKRV